MSFVLITDFVSFLSLNQPSPLAGPSLSGGFEISSTSSLDSPRSEPGSRGFSERGSCGDLGISQTRPQSWQAVGSGPGGEAVSMSFCPSGLVAFSKLQPRHRRHWIFSPPLVLFGLLLWREFFACIKGMVGRGMLWTKLRPHQAVGSGSSACCNYRGDSTL